MEILVLRGGSGRWQGQFTGKDWQWWGRVPRDCYGQPFRAVVVEEIQRQRDGVEATCPFPNLGGGQEYLIDYADPVSAWVDSYDVV